MISIVNGNLLYIVCKNVKWTEKEYWWCSLPVASWTIRIFLFLQPEHNGIHKLVTKLFLCCDWRGLNWLYDKTCQCRQMRGGHQVTSDNVITWSQAGTIPAHGWHQTLCTLRQRLRTKTSTGRSFITAAVQTDQRVYRLPQLIPPTNWKLLLSEEDTFLRLSSNRKQTQKRSSPYPPCESKS